jgi:hypothetical protein
MATLLFGPLAVRFPRLNPALVRQTAFALLLFLFICCFILWFVRYVRVERPDRGDREL